MSRRNFTRSACITPISPRTAIVLPRNQQREHTSTTRTHLADLKSRLCIRPML